MGWVKALLIAFGTAVVVVAINNWWSIPLLSPSKDKPGAKGG